jgi:Pyruvate/2-oxoglutarate dehydrogenase complex, dihydrolipoamide acyltransferase (E2) component, and related enzymes
MDINQINQGKRVRETYKINGTRKYLANMLKSSLAEYPQGTGSSYFETDRLMALKAKLHEQNEHVSITSVIAKVMTEALKKHPVMNSALINGEEFFIYDSINVGIGVGLPDGIMSVVIKEAQDKNIFEISDELQEDIALLKAKKLPFDRMSGSTITLSNMGMLGVEQFTPFLTPPETNIIGVGITKKVLVVNDDGTTRIASLTCFSSTVNHAAVDGLHGGLFFKDLRVMIEAPEEHMGL